MKRPPSSQPVALRRQEIPSALESVSDGIKRREAVAEARRAQLAAEAKQNRGDVSVTLTSQEISDDFGPGGTEQFIDARGAIVVGAAEHGMSEALYLYKCADIVTRMINDKEEPTEPRFVRIARLMRSKGITHLHPRMTFPEYARWEAAQKEAS